MLRANPSNISEEDYLQGELTSDVKHELIGGSVFAMTGASANHERICLNISSKFGDHLECSPCESFGPDMKVKTGSNYFYPDVIVACNFDESQPYFTETPIIIVEIASKTRRKLMKQSN